MRLVNNLSKFDKSMTRPKDKKRRITSRIERIERKCDRILSELLIIRQAICRPRELDRAIDRMHKAAKRMRRQCEQEYRDTLDMIDSHGHR